MHYEPLSIIHLPCIQTLQIRFFDGPHSTAGLSLSLFGPDGWVFSLGKDAACFSRAINPPRPWEAWLRFSVRQKFGKPRNVRFRGNTMENGTLEGRKQNFFIDQEAARWPYLYSSRVPFYLDRFMLVEHKEVKVIEISRGFVFLWWWNRKMGCFKDSRNAKTKEYFIRTIRRNKAVDTIPCRFTFTNYMNIWN